MFKTDLHIHTCHSVSHDLELTPKDLVDEAVKQGFKVISITDHNSIGAYFEEIDGKSLIDYARSKGLIVVPGLELTPLSWSGGPFHILVYGRALLELDPKDVPKKPSLDKIISFCKDIKSLGEAFVVVSHPYFMYCLLYVPSARIIINALKPFLGVLDGVEIVNFAHGMEMNRFVIQRLAPKLEQILGKRFLKTFGSDTHYIENFGQRCGYITAPVRTIDDVFYALRTGYIRPGIETCYSLRAKLNDPNFWKQIVKVVHDSITDLSGRQKVKV